MLGTLLNQSPVCSFQYVEGAAVNPVLWIASTVAVACVTALTLLTVPAPLLKILKSAFVMLEDFKICLRSCAIVTIATRKRKKCRYSGNVKRGFEDLKNYVPDSSTYGYLETGFSVLVVQNHILCKTSQTRAGISICERSALGSQII